MIAVANITGPGGITEYTNRLLRDSRFIPMDERQSNGEKPRQLLVQYHNSAVERAFIESCLKNYESVSVVLHDQHFENLLPDLIMRFRHRIVFTEALKARVPDAAFVAPPCMATEPCLVGFGSWRNNHTRNFDACRRAGVTYQQLGWLPPDEFERALADADGVILSYCEADSIAWASSLSTALATHKPVFLSNVRHFADAPVCSTVFKHETITELADQINDAFRMPYLRKHQWYAHANEIYELLK